MGTVFFDEAWGDEQFEARDEPLPAEVASESFVRLSPPGCGRTFATQLTAR